MQALNSSHSQSDDADDSASDLHPCMHAILLMRSNTCRSAPPSIRNALDAKRSNLRELESNIRNATKENTEESRRTKNLKSRRSHLLEEINLLQSVFSPVWRVPPEILALMFRLAIRSHGTLFVHLLHPILLTCYHWHEVAVSAPSLWATLVLPVALPAYHGTRRELPPISCRMNWLKRSRDLPLDLMLTSPKFYDWLPIPEPFADGLIRIWAEMHRANVWNRLECLSMFNMASDSLERLALPQHAFPRLRTFELQVRRRYDTIQLPQLAHCLTMREVFLDLRCFIHNSLMHFCPWKLITDLCIVGYAWTMRDVLIVLAQCATLQRCKLSYSDAPDSVFGTLALDLGSRINLGALVTLDFYANAYCGIVEVLQQFCCPRLRNFSLTCASPGPAWKACLAAFADRCPLLVNMSLDILSGDIDASEWPLSSFSGVRHLRIPHCGPKDFAISLLNDITERDVGSQHPTAPLFPNLLTLTIDKRSRSDGDRCLCSAIARLLLSRCSVQGGRGAGLEECRVPLELHAILLEQMKPVVEKNIIRIRQPEPSLRYLWGFAYGHPFWERIYRL
ncbi:hypothetical protein FISHEDRAFT_59384 [Fistulina hepatica ATCC 64428]|uniref:F-box domain-containing protein n=1 Tax=Fistulina hepatica ATCC 64428 TaxID=1128425 RepID=A0A0D7AAS4_9AGAR|nr:hypothetical protein FISHEDRAFT_59384 [Fistulina hepatica ATCC 64428]